MDSNLRFYFHLLYIKAENVLKLVLISDFSCRKLYLKVSSNVRARQKEENEQLSVVYHCSEKKVVFPFLRFVVLPRDILPTGQGCAFPLPIRY